MSSPLLQPGLHQVQVNGITLSYEVKGQGPLLVWHPGGPGMKIQGYPGYEVMSAAFTVVYLDPRGVGKSSHLVETPNVIVKNVLDLEIPGSEAYALERYSDDLAALQKLWEVDKINLAGHSHGGFVVLDYATRYPDNVANLVVVGSAGAMHIDDPRYEQRRQPKMETEAYKRYLALFEEKEKAGFSPLDWYKYGLLMQLTIDVHDFDKHEARLLDGIMPLGEEGLSFVPAYHFEKHDIHRYDMRPRYADIKARVLFIQGRQETLFFPEDIDEAVEKIADAQVTWIDQCAHMPMTEQPEALMQALTSFLK